jgi:acetyl esterase/lipase
MVGNCDPLEDDCWRFGERLLGVGVDFGMVLYEGFPHGFLGFDLKFNGVRETREAVEQGSRYLRELMEAEEAEVRINS